MGKWLKKKTSKIIKQQTGVYETNKKVKHNLFSRLKNIFQIKNKVSAFYSKAKQRTRSSLKLEILCMVVIAFCISVVAFLVVRTFINQTDMGRRRLYSYEDSRTRVQEGVLRAVSEINSVGTEKSNLYTDLYSIKFSSEIVEMIRSNPKEETLENLEMYLSNMLNINNENETFNTLSTIERIDNLEGLYSKLLKIINKGSWSEDLIAKEIIDYYDRQGINKEYISEVKIKNILSNIEAYINGTTYLINSQGKLMYQDGFVEALDIIKVIQKVNSSEGDKAEDAFSAIYPVIIDEEVYYLFSESTLTADTHYYYTGIGSVIGFITAIGIFIGLLFKFIKPKIDYVEYLSHCLEEISKGDLTYKIQAIGADELAQVAKNITYMESEIKLQIEAQVKAEKVKNELITNVAHDLRTPLTSIIGYIGLVKNKQFQGLEDEAKYLEIAYTKAEKLKILIEDLFELTKLHQQEDKTKKEIISITNLINQLIEEMMLLANEKNINIETFIIAKEASIRADVPKITRVFENLIQNAIKYSGEGEAIYVELKELEKEVNVTVSNRSHDITQEEVDRVFDRFYRADKSRNSTIGGSGLGLAIAKSIVEFHGGKITAKLEADLISFKVRLPKYRMIAKEKLQVDK